MRLLNLTADLGDFFNSYVCSNDVMLATITTNQHYNFPFLWRLLLSQTLLAGSGAEIAPRPSGLKIFLLLADLRSGLGDAAFYEISLNLQLLLRAYVHHGVEGQIAR